MAQREIGKGNQPYKVADIGKIMTRNSRKEFQTRETVALLFLLFLSSVLILTGIQEPETKREKRKTAWQQT